MGNIYTAMYICKSIHPIGLPSYADVVLGLHVGNGNSDILIKGTCSKFVVGNEYLINIMEKP